MEYKVEVAKKILTIANDYDGQVYGGFVRDVIVPRINNANCNVSFKDVDIWFQDKIAVHHFISELVKNFKIENENKWNKDFDYNNQKGANFSREQYRIYSKAEFLFHIDVITSDNLPVNDFDVNTITYRYDGKFQKVRGLTGKKSIINKTAIMFEDYNPLSSIYYYRIDRIFFSKGWTIRCHSKHEDLSKFIRNNKLKVKEFSNGAFYDYVPIDVKDDISKSDISGKLILRLIFDKGLEVLNGRVYNSIEDNDLQNIYKFGLEEYRTKVDNLLK